MSNVVTQVQYKVVPGGAGTSALFNVPTYVGSFTIQPLPANTGNVAIGPDAVPISESGYSMPPRGAGVYDLAQIRITVANSTDGVVVIAAQPL